MDIEERINSEIKIAMLAKNAKKLDSLRAIKSVILILKSSTEGLTEDSITKALQKEVKKRKESADIYKSQNRSDLEDIELFQASVIEEYLPKQLNDEQIKKELEKIIASVGATNSSHIGKVMGAASKVFAGRADNKIVSSIVKQILG